MDKNDGSVTNKRDTASEGRSGGIYRGSEHSGRGVQSQGDSDKSIRIYKIQVTVMVLLFCLVVIVFGARAVLPIAGLGIQDDLGIAPVHFGFLLSIFYLTYGVMSLFTLFLFRIFRVRVIMGFAVVGWSITEMFVWFTSHSYDSIFWYRLILGIFEAPIIISAIKVIGDWFGRRDRPIAFSTYYAMGMFSQAFMPIVLVVLMTSYGWRAILGTLGFIGIVIVVFWFLLYDNREDITLTIDEEKYFRGGVMTTNKPIHFTMAKWLGMLKQPSLLGMIFCLASGGFTAVFGLTWFPAYLQEIHGFDFLDMGFVATFPLLSSGFGMLFSIAVTTKLMKAGNTSLPNRRVIIAAALVLSAVFTCLIILFQPNYLSIVLFCAAVFFGQFATSQTWTLSQMLVKEHILSIANSYLNSGSVILFSIPPIIGGLSLEYSMGFNIGFGACTFFTLMGAFACLIMIHRPVKFGENDE